MALPFGVLYPRDSDMRIDESQAAEVWRRTIAQIESLFGRLVYVSSLRDANTGIYKHHGFSQRFTPRQADLTIRRSHANIFTDWLCFSLEDQKNDLDLYFDNCEGDRIQIILNWSEWLPYLNWVPVQARDAERDLFRTDLATVLELVRQECAVASPGPNASLLL